MNRIGQTIRLIAAVKAATGIRRRGLRALLTGAVWMVGAALAQRSQARYTVRDVRRHDFRWQTRGMGLRRTEWLRDRLRAGWLRIRRPDE